MFWENLKIFLALNWWISIAAGAAIAAILLVIRGALYGRLKKWAKRTSAEWGDLVISKTSLASLLWCLWLGIYVGLQLAALPAFLLPAKAYVVPGLFVALGTYTLAMLLVLGITWYEVKISSRTSSRVDDYIAATLKVSLPVVLAFLGIIWILEILDVDVSFITDWLGLHGAKVALLLGMGIALLLGVAIFVPRIINGFLVKSKAEATEDEFKKRSETLIGVVTATLQVIVVGLLILMLLSEFGINITAVLAGVGVAGIAIGFGAQSLVKDVIAGLFVILENQYRKGDVVKIADTSGLVEDINLRRTLLRDLDGAEHVVPNGEIRVATNMTKRWSRVNMTVRVSYRSDIDHVIGVINRVGKELAQDPKWCAAIISPPQTLRVDSFGEYGIDIRILGDTKPIRQWEIMGELRLRLKRAFDAEGIEIPYIHLVLGPGTLQPVIVQDATKK